MSQSGVWRLGERRSEVRYTVDKKFQRVGALECIRKV